MSAHVLLNSLNELACRTFYYLFAISLITSKLKEHEC